MGVLAGLPGNKRPREEREEPASAPRLQSLPPRHQKSEWGTEGDPYPRLPGSRQDTRQPRVGEGRATPAPLHNHEQEMAAEALSHRVSAWLHSGTVRTFLVWLLT